MPVLAATPPAEKPPRAVAGAAGVGVGAKPPKANCGGAAVLGSFVCDAPDEYPNEIPPPPVAVEGGGAEAGVGAALPKANDGGGAAGKLVSFFCGAPDEPPNVKPPVDVAVGAGAAGAGNVAPAPSMANKVAAALASLFGSVAVVVGAAPNENPGGLVAPNPFKDLPVD